MLTKEELDQYKASLEERRTELMKKIEENSAPHNEATEVVEGGEEEADEAEDFSNQLAVAQTYRDEVQEIDTALERMREGNYGKCAKCGMDISKDVLAAAPESVLCEQCKLQV